MTHPATIPSVENDLLKLCADRANLSTEEVLNVLLRPEWGSAEVLYDWRNYVADDMRQFWPLLSTESRLVALCSALHSAFEA